MQTKDIVKTLRLKRYNPTVLEQPSIIAKKLNKNWKAEILMEHLDFEDLMFARQYWQLRPYCGVFGLEYNDVIIWRSDRLDSWV